VGIPENAHHSPSSLGKFTLLTGTWARIKHQNVWGNEIKEPNYQCTGRIFRISRKKLGHSNIAIFLALAKTIELN